MDAKDKIDCEAMIRRECDAIKDFLIEKNSKYGNSVLDPITAASKASPQERIRSRIDDKICRLVRGNGDDEDTLKDLAGYIVLLRVAEKLDVEPGVLQPGAHPAPSRGPVDFKVEARRLTDADLGAKDF